MKEQELKRTVKVFQWNGEEKDLPDGFHLCKPEIHHSFAGDVLYFSYADLRPECWIDTKRVKEKPEVSTFSGALSMVENGETLYRAVYPFAFYDIKSLASATGDHKPVFLDYDNEEHLKAFVDYAWKHKWLVDDFIPQRLEYRQINGSYGRGYQPFYMKPTDWILFDGEKIEVVSDEEYQKLVI